MSAQTGQAVLRGHSGREYARGGDTDQGVRRQQTSRSAQTDRETSRVAVSSSERLALHSQSPKDQSPAGHLVHNFRQQRTSLRYSSIQLATSLKIPKAP